MITYGNVWTNTVAESIFRMLVNREAAGVVVESWSRFSIQGTILTFASHAIGQTICQVVSLLRGNGSTCYAV